MQKWIFYISDKKGLFNSLQASQIFINNICEKYCLGPDWELNITQIIQYCKICHFLCLTVLKISAIKVQRD